jgi:hypothetical protein
MERVTIDNIGMPAHNRYAKDKALLDPIFLTEPQLIAPHVPNNSVSSIYSSKWEELFDIQKKNLPWAVFSPPPHFLSRSHRLFSYHFFVCLAQDEDEGEPSDEENEDSSLFEKKKKALSQLMQLQRAKEDVLLLFEKDRSCIVSLLDAIEKLERLLAHIHSRKLQYQKG